VRSSVEVGLEEFEELGGADPAVCGEGGDRYFFGKVVLNVVEGQVEGFGIVGSVRGIVGGEGMAEQGAVSVKRQDVLIEFVGMVGGVMVQATIDVLQTKGQCDIPLGEFQTPNCVYGDSWGPSVGEVLHSMDIGPGKILRRQEFP